MARTRWRRMGLEEQTRLWESWHVGRSAGEIARELDRSRHAIRYVLERHGGYAPATHKRADDRLTLAQREEISRGISAELSARHIAQRIGKHHSTVSREIKRNGGRARYRATLSEQSAWKRAARPKCCLLRQRPRLCAYVARGLQRRWSPQQIAARLERHYPRDQSMRVSHETIYRTLFVQSRGALRQELTQYLRTARKVRHARKASNKGQGRGQIVDAISIRERPAQVEDRAVPGHWEGDLISGSHNSHIATLVERKSRYVMLMKVPSKETNVVVKAIIAKMKKLPVDLRRSMTWDCGKEMAHHKVFTIATDMPVYFCDPHSPWQRGSNENTNGLLRQYFPKGTDLSVHSQAHLNAVARELNQRPRETLAFQTPAEKLSETVALTI
jgi:IS30 family transposase